MGAILLRGDEILLVERAKEPLLGYWSLPGGIVETGETLETAVRREVLEETGLVIEPREVVEVFERIMPDAAGRVEYHYVLLDYLCDAVGGTLSPADDVSQARWFPKQALDGLRLTQGTLPVIEKAFELRDRRQSNDSD